MSVVRRWVVRGRVQGVFFRESTRQEAVAIGGLRGFVRNLGDGSVEVVAAGEAPSLERLLEFLRRGPPAAAVEAVEETQAPPSGDSGIFEIRR